MELPLSLHFDDSPICLAEVLLYQCSPAVTVEGASWSWADDAPEDSSSRKSIPARGELDEFFKSAGLLMVSVHCRFLHIGAGSISIVASESGYLIALTPWTTPLWSDEFAAFVDEIDAACGTALNAAFAPGVRCRIGVERSWPDETYSTLAAGTVRSVAELKSLFTEWQRAYAAG